MYRARRLFGEETEESCDSENCRETVSLERERDRGNGGRYNFETMGYVLARVITCKCHLERCVQEMEIFFDLIVDPCLTIELSYW